MIGIFYYLVKFQYHATVNIVCVVAISSV